MNGKQGYKHLGLEIDIVKGGKWVSKCACGWKSQESDYFKTAKEEREKHWNIKSWSRSEPGEDDRVKKYLVEYRWKGSDGKVGKGPGI